MKNIYIYHPNRATGIGGIETLIRSFALSRPLGDYRFTHIYNYIPDTCVSKPVEFISDNFKEIRINLPKHIKGKLLTCVRTYLFYKAIINETHPGDTIIVFHPTDIAFLTKSNLAGRKLLLIQTNPFDKLLDTHISRITMNRAIAFISAISVYTKKDQQRFVQMFPEYKGDIFIIPRGCRLKTSVRLPKYSTKLVTIARIDEKQKDFDSMLNVFKLLPSRYSLDIYGDGDPCEIKTLKTKVISTKGVRYMGPTSDITSTLNNYSVFLMTSKFEGFGQTLIEARSQGLPLVAYNTFDALSWIIHHGVNGFCIEPGDSYKFADAILKITKSSEDYNCYAEKNLGLAVETDSEKIASLWAALFEKYTKV